MGLPRRFEDGLDGAGEGVQGFLLSLHDVEGAAVHGAGDDSLSRERPHGTEQEREAEGWARARSRAPCITSPGDGPCVGEWPGRGDESRCQG